jgi:hypothetical protein
MPTSNTRSQPQAVDQNGKGVWAGSEGETVRQPRDRLRGQSVRHVVSEYCAYLETLALAGREANNLCSSAVRKRLTD